MAIYGLVLIRPDVYGLWVFPSKHIKEHAIVYLKAAKRFVDTIQRNIQADRIETTTYDDDTHAKWLRYLGFECESGPLRNYSKGQSFRQWAIINDR